MRFCCSGGDFPSPSMPWPLAVKTANVLGRLDWWHDSGRHPYGSLTTLATGSCGRKEFKRLASFSGGT